MNTIVCGYFAFCAPANGEGPSSSTSTSSTMASPLLRVTKKFDPRFSFERARLLVAPQSLINMNRGFSRMLSAPQLGLQSVVCKNTGDYVRPQIKPCPGFDL
jgi:hypothetical protein